MMLDEKKEKEKKTYAKIILGIIIAIILFYVIFFKLIFSQNSQTNEVIENNQIKTNNTNEIMQEETDNKVDNDITTEENIIKINETERDITNLADLSSIKELQGKELTDFVDIDSMTVNDGSVYKNYEETIMAWAEGKQKWYKDKEGVIYIQPGTTFKMNDILMTFGEKETVGAIGYGGGIFMIIPVHLRNIAEGTRSIMPNQVFYKVNVPNSCSKKIFQSTERFTNMLENTTLEAGEEKIVYIYMPFYGNIKTPEGYEELLKDNQWYENILLRYQQSQYINVVIPYTGPIVLTDDNSQYKKECLPLEFEE